MKKRIALLVVMTILLGVITASHYIRITYHMSLLEYFSGKHQITPADRDYLERHGPIIYGSGNNSPPLYYVDEETGHYKGVVIDYLQALSLELKTEIQYQPMTWDEALKSLEAGETHLCDMYPSKERARKYLFSDPIYYQRGIILVSSDNTTLQHVSGLAGLRVGVQTGDYAHEFLRNQPFEIDFVFSENYEEGLQKLLADEVDAIVGDEPVMSYLIQKYRLSEDYRIVDEPMYELPSVLGIPQDKSELKRIIDKGIASLNQTTVVNKIQQKWFGISTPIGKVEAPTHLSFFFLAGSSLILLVLVTVVIWNLELKNAVLQRTQALQRSEKNLQTVMDELRYMVMVVNDQFQLLTANRQYYHHFGNGQFQHHSTLEEVIPSLSKVKHLLLNPTGNVIEIPIKGRTYQLDACPIQYGSSMEAATLLMMEDITDRKIHEAQLFHDHKMAAIGQLAAGVAHEIRNPLGLIRNYTFIMKRSDSDPLLLKKSLQLIDQSVEKASNVIDNLLNFYRLADSDFREINLKTLIEEVVSLNENLMKDHTVYCRLVLHDVSIKTCEASLKHILINLLNNATDAMPQGGQITVSLREKPDTIELRVIDKGMGMSEETREMIFHPFFTTKRSGKGTGLGCYIVYSELVKLKGEIAVISKQHVGTTMVIKLKKAAGDHDEA
ncbi:transporter substrate-binding domain-containing protein [Anoxynatronum buryatiense]|uniref:histidine kinase n=1 Tax=Anoxynatronum buryatiense TaxID=489973 RepID=A0AA45WXU1_9CLOT|nr:transporter substrate-binding domain-containing protein [Anoxynatronum buryatiense]SMP66154.1 amino acid-binding domain sensor histidine kinase [Anoxynatronum buryatiense]